MIDATTSGYRTNPPNQPKGFSTYYLDQLNLERRQRLLKLICLSSAALIFLGGLYPLFMASTTNNPAPYLLTLVSLAGAACFLTSYFLIRKPNSSLGRLKGVTAFVVSSALVEIFVSQFLNADTESFFALTFFTLIPVLAGVLGVSGRAIQLVTFSAFSSMIASFFIKLILYHPSGIGYTTLVNAVLNFVAIIVVTFIFVRQSVRSSQLSARQALELHKLVATLNTTNEVGVSLSHNLANVTSELSLTSHQQSSSTQEQVASITEITASLEELSGTANQIALSANSATSLAQRTLAVALEVKHGREEALRVAEEGDQAVAQTDQSVKAVRDRIELMGQRLLNLTEQTRRVGSIIDLIDEIADETHLLALNASIEAAGHIGGRDGEETGVSTGRSKSGRGERFGVIAQEIKNLAERSRESTEEVRQAITEMQGAVAAAVLVAEEGKKATAQALLRSGIAGAVITKLNDITEGSSGRFDEIVLACEEVKEHCDEIRIATGQQRSANQQIVSTMQDIAEIARENVSIVAELSNKALKVNEEAARLNSVLHLAVKENSGGSSSSSSEVDDNETRAA